jgi:hypothetical protein
MYALGDGRASGAELPADLRWRDDAVLRAPPAAARADQWPHPGDAGVAAALLDESRQRDVKQAPAGEAVAAD